MERAEAVPRIPAPWSQQPSPANSGAGGGVADTTSASLLNRKQGSGTGGPRQSLQLRVMPTTPCGPLPLPTAAVTANQTTPDTVETIPDLGFPSSPTPLSSQWQCLQNQTTLDKIKVPAVPVPLVVTPVTPVLPAAPRH